MKEKVVMIVFILILGSAWTTALVGVDRWTAPIIEKHQTEKRRASILNALGIEYQAGSLDQAFVENVESVENGDKVFYRAKNGSVAFAITGSGVQGPITGVVAMCPDLETIAGITIVSQEETPGLGDRLFESEALARFKGKKVVPELLIKRPGKANGDNEVDGVTGATLTCGAFQKLLNSQTREYIILAGGDGQ